MDAQDNIRKPISRIKTPSVLTGDLGKITMDWSLLLTLTGLAIAGIFIGSFFAKRIAADRLKQGFGWFVLVMGIYIIVKELFFASSPSH